MKVSIFKVFTIFSIVSNWSAQALADGSVSLEEAANLAIQIANCLGLKTRFNIDDIIN